MAHLDDLADSIAKEERMKRAIKILGTKYDVWTKEYLLRLYSDPKIHSIYNGLRAEASLKKQNIKDDTSNRRLVVKYPNVVVYRFLDDVFTPKYGEEWASDKDILAKVMLNEDLIQPWIISRI